MSSVAPPMTTARHRPLNSAQTRMSPGWILIAAPIAPLMPRIAGRSSQRQPMANVANRIGPTCPSFSAYTNGNDQPARSRIHQRMSRATGSTATPTRKAASDPAIHAHVAVVAASRPNGRTQRRERRRVIEQPEPARLGVGHVVQRLPGEDARRRLVIGKEVEPERRAGNGQGQADPEDQRQDRDDGERRATEVGDPLARHRPSACSSTRPPRRCSRGIRNRSQATRSASGIDGRIREPRLSYQRIGTTAVR